MVDFLIGTRNSLAHGQKIEKKKYVKQANTLAATEKHKKIQQIKPTNRKRAKHKHIECVLLLLTITPAAHRK